MGQILQRDVKVGGLGLSVEEMGILGASIEAGYVKFHAPIMEEEKKKQVEQFAIQAQKIEERKKKEAEEHAKWFQERIAARKAEEVATAAAATDLKKFFALPLELKQEKVETERFGKMVGAVEAGTKVIVGPMNEKKENSGQPAARAEVKISAQTVEIRAAAPAKPRIDDVARPAARLTGPIQELQNMSLPEFRRLSKDPDEAARKILEKIETLAKESFERRAEGVQSWQSCALQRSYVSLVGAAFAAGKPVGVLAEEKHAADANILSPAEISSILSLNSQLHY